MSRLPTLHVRVSVQRPSLTAASTGEAPDVYSDLCFHLYRPARIQLWTVAISFTRLHQDITIY